NFYRLVDGKNCSEKSEMFYVDKNCFQSVNQYDFELIPGCTIAYWLNKKWFDLFNHDTIEDVAVSKAGVVSGNDEYFVKN
ncbi:MAG: hypothetical protein WCZ43_08215, partial [Proteiniphilum sp.]